MLHTSACFVPWLQAHYEPRKETVFACYTPNYNLVAGGKVRTTFYKETMALRVASSPSRTSY